MEQDEKQEFQHQRAGDSIVIGLIDGLTVPFALAAGLTAVLNSSSKIFTACISMTIAYSIFMGVSAYISGKKYSSLGGNFSSAVIIGVSYIAGGFIAISAFLFCTIPLLALKISVIVTVCFLLIAGYYESKFHGANVYLGAARTAFIALLAAIAAYGIAILFR